ncbi:MAG: lamin tail domain-containing protein, partial [Bacteroidia bacterium]
MNRIIFLLNFLFFHIISYAQFTDNFDDGDFTNNPTWSGNDTVFTIANVSGNNMLRSNSQTTNNTFYLSTPSTLVNDCQWEFFVNLQFNTSSANYVDVYLISNSADLKAASFNGYFVRIGNTADEISLYRRTGTTSTMIINGTDGITNFSNNVLKIKVVRTAANVWTLEYDNTGTGNDYFLEGSVTDATHLTSTHFGISITQSTSSFFNKHFFDDFYVGPIIYDTTPPQVNSVSVISSTQLDIFFNENVDLTSSQNVNNYIVNNSIGNPVTATRDASNFKLVHLTFANSFISGLTNIITIQNVQDVALNPMASPQNLFFTYYTTSLASFRDIIFNELFPDPSPVVGLPEQEFVELYNRSNNNINLSGLRFSDISSTAILGNEILLPGEYIILCRIQDTALFSPFGKVMGLSPWPRLNNSSDSLWLRDAGGNIIDFVYYTDAWYKNSAKKNGGWTLELINPLLPCSGVNNWIASVNPSGGTPGTQNSVFSNTLDNIPPIITNIQVVSQTQLAVTFSESMDSTTLVNGFYTISNSIGIDVVTPIGPDFTTMNVSLLNLIDTGIVYTFTAIGITDCSGNLISNSGNNKIFGIGRPAQKFEVVINELFPDPSGTPFVPEKEFVELYNTTNQVLSLRFYRWSDLSTSTLLPDVTIFPNEYIILCANADISLFEPFGRTVGLSSWPSLNNAGDVMTLRDNAGNLIHQIAYNNSWYNDQAKQRQGGWSIEMKDPRNPCGEENNWSASVSSNRATPGQMNSVATSNLDTQAPELIAAFAISPDTALLRFNEILDSLSIYNATYTISEGISANVIGLKSPKEILLKLTPNLQASTTYILVVTQINDCVGNTTIGSGTFLILPEQGELGDIIINEVLFNPRTGGSDFVEIYNRSNKDIDLRNWKLANFANDTISSVRTISDDYRILRPGNYVMLSKDTANIKKEYPLAESSTFIQMSSKPAYNNTSGTVILLTNKDDISDRFDYSEKMHFPLLNSKKGVSLERLDFYRPTNDETNWQSAAESVGFATPGYKNSQYLPSD